MKKGQIKPDVVYAIGSHHQHQRGVVVSTDQHIARHRTADDYSGRRTLTAYVPVDFQTDRSGLLVLFCWRGNDIPDAELLQLAKQAREAVEAGTLPKLPEGVSLGLRGSRHVLRPWVEQVALNTERAEQAQAAFEARKRAADAEEAAYRRIRALVGDDVNTEPRSYVDTEALINRALDARAKRLEEAAAGCDYYVPSIPDEQGKAAKTAQAHTLRHAAAVVRGDLAPMFWWLPSHQWTDEMLAAMKAGRDR